MNVSVTCDEMLSQIRSISSVGNYTSDILFGGKGVLEISRLVTLPERFRSGRHQRLITCSSTQRLGIHTQLGRNCSRLLVILIGAPLNSLSYFSLLAWQYPARQDGTWCTQHHANTLVTNKSRSNISHFILQVLLMSLLSSSPPSYHQSKKTPII